MGFDPITVALVVIAASAAVGAVGSIQQGKAAQEAAEFNAQMASDAASSKIKAAGSDAAKRAMIDEAEMAANRVYFNTRGVRIDDGSPAISLKAQAGIRGMNIAAIRMRGMEEAGAMYNQASLYRFEGKQAKTASYFSAATSLLSGGGKMLSVYSKSKATSID